MTTTAEIVVEFVQGRPKLEATLRKKMTDTFRAPEEYAPVCADLVKEALLDVSDDEKTLLDRMHGKGNVVWEDVARAFGAPLFLGDDDPAKDPKPAPSFDWAKARALGTELAKESSALSASLLEFEKRVVGLDLGVEASVPIDAESQLRFCRQNQGWGLFVVTPKGCDSLRHVPRRLRILAAHHGVALLARLVEEGERTLEGVREAKECAAEAIEVVGDIGDGSER